jgi:hypothetical protein
MDQGITGIAARIENAATKVLGRARVERPLDLFESVVENAPRIAKANLLSEAKDAALVEAFDVKDASILLYLPGFLPLGQEASQISTPLKVDGKPLKLAFQGGGSLLGIGFEGDGQVVQLFHVDLVLPGF